MYLCIDTETGGLTTDYSLLTLAAIVADEEFSPIRGGTAADTLTLEIRHPTYVVSPEALTVNRIDLIHHSARGLKLEQAQQKFADFVRQAKEMCGKKLIPVGHNLQFDLGFVWAQLMQKSDWDQYCDYHFLDTMVAARFFKAAGVIQGGCRLDDLREFFHIDTGVAHTALADTKATLAVARALKTIAGNTTAQGQSGS